MNFDESLENGAMFYDKRIDEHCIIAASRLEDLGNRQETIIVVYWQKQMEYQDYRIISIHSLLEQGLWIKVK